MRIGIDGRFWNESGVGRYIRNLVRELNKLDEEDEFVLFVYKESGIKNQELRKNWEVVPTDIRWHTIEEQIKFPKLLNSYTLDLVHFPYFSVPIFYNKPFIVTIHDLILHHYATGKATTLPKPVYFTKLQSYKFVMNQAAKKSKKIITVSEATKSEIIDHLHVPPQKVVVTYEGADEHLKISEKKHLEKYFLYVGNAYPHKNLEFLIRTFSELSDPTVRLQIVGRADYFQKRLQKQTDGDQRITFITDADDAMLSTLYSNALALVSPSRMEGFGLPLLEAMKLGCLVIASDIPSSREICGDAALYFDLHKIDSLRTLLEKVMNDTVDRKQYINSGKKRSEFFSWEKMAGETLTIYKSAF